VDVSVVIPTYSPDLTRLSRTLAGLRLQTLSPNRWECLVIDNASQPPITLADLADAPSSTRIIVEPTLGLNSARRTGFRASSGEIIVLVDDDNVLAPDYLEQALRAFARLPKVAALGGKSTPEFASPPAPWQTEFLPLLALRDLGENEIVSTGLRSSSGTEIRYPSCSPIGAGMALRRKAAEAWLDLKFSINTDRLGNELTSGGDNDLVLTVLEQGWEVAYLPQLSLTHLIPASRLTKTYLARLNRGIQKSWMQVLSAHQANPWTSIPAWTVAPRKVKAWFSHRAWADEAAYVRWQGACGHFEGRISKQESR
jgi:glycosyltransferase involved in cell wall biosynthesis